MEQVGVEAVVRGLSKFVGDIGKMNSALKSIEPSGNIISRTIEGVSGWFDKLGGSMLRVAETALGVLVRDAFLAVVNGLKEIVGSTIEAGSEFQSLQLRLTRLDLNTVFKDAAQNVEEFENVMRKTRSEYRIQKMEWQKAPTMADAMDIATQAAKEQLSWVQRLAATTPFDFQDVANVYTLARSYGFADEAARGLTRDISDFSAGMGLGNTEIERIIVNMGQMVQQGKVTSREMNDLARGAFVPVNDVLDIMREKTGLSGKAFDDFRNSAKGVELFMSSFSELVKTRFQGASEDMARTFKGATDNVKDFIKSIFGFGLVTPILDKVGGKIADILEGLTSPGNFAAISLSVQRLGEAISNFVGDLLNIGNLDTGSIVQWLLQTVNRATAWLNRNGKMIVDSIRNIFSLISTGDFKGGIFGLSEDSPPIRFLIKLAQFGPSIKNIVQLLTSGDFTGGIFGLYEDSPFILFLLKVSEAFRRIQDWVQTNGPLIETFFMTLGEIVSGVFENLFNIEPGTSGLQTFLDGVKTFMQYVIDNQDGITEFVTNLVKVWGALQLIGFVLSLVLPPIIAVIGFFLGLASAIIGLISVASILLNPLTWIIGAFALIGLGIGGLIGLTAALIANWETAGPMFGEIWEAIKTTILDIFANLVEGISTGFSRWWELTTTNLSGIYQYFFSSFQNIADLLSPTKWGALGKKMIEGITRGIKEAAGNFLSTLRGIVEEAIELVEELLKLGSPSKVFAEIGSNLMEGLAIGIEKTSGMAMSAMQNAIAGVTMPAVYASAEMGGMVSTQNNYAYNYNLTVNSSAPSEQVIQDYNMLQSLSGG